MTTPGNWPDPERAGVPMFPERDGFHIIGRLAWKWHAASELWDGVANPDEFGTFYYVGPCLTPAQISEMLAGERERAAKAATEVSDTYYDQREEAESDNERVYADERMCAAQECAEAIRNLGDTP